MLEGAAFHFHNLKTRNELNFVMLTVIESCQAKRSSSIKIIYDCVHLNVSPSLQSLSDVPLCVT